MFEVAKLAGVSHQTVSRVINHSPDVSDATREKVQKAIDQLGYRPSNSARALASHRSRTIGLIAGGQHFYGPISTISAIETMARQHGLFVTVSMVHEALCSQEEFDDLCRTFDEMNVDAFIFLTPTDVMFSAACRTRIAQPRVIVTSTHGGIGVQDGLRLMKSADRRRVAPAGMEQAMRGQCGQFRDGAVRDLGILRSVRQDEPHPRQHRPHRRQSADMHGLRQRQPGRGCGPRAA